MHHVAVAGLNHAGAQLHRHQDAVAGLARLLAVKADDVGAVALNETVVVLVIARSQNHALGGVELDVGAVLLLAHHTGDRAGLVGDQLHAWGVVEELDAALLGKGGQGDDELEVALRLGTVVPLVAHGLGAVLIGVLDPAHGRRRVAGLLGTQAQPTHGLARVISVILGQTAVGTPLTALHVTVDVVLDALGVAHLELDAALVGTLRDASALLLQDAGGGALLDGGEGGRHAAGAASHDHDVVGLLISELGDGLDHNRGVLVVGSARTLRIGDARTRLGSLVGNGDGCGGSGGNGGSAGGFEEIPAVQFHRSSFLSSTRPRQKRGRDVRGQRPDDENHATSRSRLTHRMIRTKRLNWENVASGRTSHVTDEHDKTLFAD